MRPLVRRTFLLSGAALLTGCALPGGPDSTTATPTSNSSAPSSAASTSTAPAAVATPSLRAVRPWQPGPNEVRARIKVVASRAVEAVGRDEGRVTQVVYPQYGGLVDTSASVMVLAEQSWIDQGALRGRSLTFDVRLERTAGSWAVADVGRFGGPTLDEAGLRGAAASVAASPNIDLPAAALGDMAAGDVDVALLRVLRGLSQTYSMSVSVFGSGHPREVFGTTGLSNHTRGRAFDVWAVDGVPVVEMEPDDARLRAFLVAARELGSDEIGGPVDLDGPGGVHFANALHRDHVHVGLDP